MATLHTSDSGQRANATGASPIAASTRCMKPGHAISALARIPSGRVHAGCESCVEFCCDGALYGYLPSLHFRQ